MPSVVRIPRHAETGGDAVRLRRENEDLRQRLRRAEQSGAALLSVVRMIALNPLADADCLRDAARRAMSQAG
jgi:hypothetical protein